MEPKSVKSLPPYKKSTRAEISDMWGEIRESGTPGPSLPQPIGSRVDILIRLLGGRHKRDPPFLMRPRNF